MKSAKQVKQEKRVKFLQKFIIVSPNIAHKFKITENSTSE